MPSKDPENTVGQYDDYIFVVVEYNHSMTRALENALDQAYKEWNRKPFTAIGYGGLGGWARHRASARNRRRTTDGFDTECCSRWWQRLHCAIPDGRQ